MGKSKNWTDEEKDFLRENWGYHSVGYIAKKLGRSENAILIKVQRFHLGAFLEAGEYISLNQLSVIFCGKGKGDYTVRTVWVREGLPIHYKQVNKCRFAMVKMPEFWKWAEHHREIVDFSRLEKNELGPEPKWVAQARKVDYGKPKVRIWTKCEDELLQRMVKRGNFLDEIAKNLSRTEAAVKRRIYDLALSGELVKRAHKAWSDEDVEKLLQLRADGYSWEKIGEHLGRSALACRGKFERLYNPQYRHTYYARTYKGVLKDCFQRNQCIHYKKALGCAKNGTNCDECEFFCRRKEDDDSSGWNSVKQVDVAKEMLEKFKAEKEKCYEQQSD